MLLDSIGLNEWAHFAIGLSEPVPCRNSATRLLFGPRSSAGCLPDIFLLPMQAGVGNSADISPFRTKLGTPLHKLREWDHSELRRVRSLRFA
jgi:hypothetical protein